MTKAEFLAQYRAGIIKAFEWTQDATRLERFMASVEATVYGPGCPWNHNSDVATAIYRANGGKGRVTLKWLRALPEG